MILSKYAWKVVGAAVGGIEGGILFCLLSTFWTHSINSTTFVLGAAIGAIVGFLFPRAAAFMI